MFPVCEACSEILPSVEPLPNVPGIALLYHQPGEFGRLQSDVLSEQLFNKIEIDLNISWPLPFLFSASEPAANCIIPGILHPHSRASSSILCQDTSYISNLAALGHGLLVVQSAGPRRESTNVASTKLSLLPVPWVMQAPLLDSATIPDSFFFYVYSCLSFLCWPLLLLPRGLLRVLKNSSGTQPGSLWMLLRVAWQGEGHS